MPLIGEDPTNINEAESIKILRYAIDQGVNYLDLGYPYDISQHERLTRLISRALQDGYRQQIKLAASLPSFLISSSLDFDRYLNEQLKWLQTDRIDFYLLAGLNRETWPRLQELDALSWAEGALSDGRIGRLGFSFHDHFQVLRDILEAYDNWALCQFQYSYMDVDHLPGVSGLKYAAERGLAVVITEPLRGGRLTKEPPESVAKVWASTPQKRTLSEWGLRWVWNHPEVSTVVSDMSTMEQVVANVALADSAEPDSLTVQEEVVISQVREAYRKLSPIPCTYCRACMPCPQGIDVPRIFELYNDAIMYDDMETARSIYRMEQHNIDSCNECGACVDACGKEIAIMDWLKKLSALAFG
ncbi:MAG: aldo/keto reductase [Dehalococcoidales bacterium]|nr:aldo/keto reductase [Dehalococcoidales bacterium]